MTRAMLLLPGLGCIACNPTFPLEDVPVVGGTAEARTLIGVELAAFEQWVGEGRVHLREVSIEPVEAPFAGRYRHRTRQIFIDSSVPLHELRTLVRHELCHALEHYDDLANVSLMSPIERFAERLEASHASLSADNMRAEAIATACEPGPVAGIGWTKACDGDDDLAAELGAWMASEVWRGFAEEDVVGLGVETTATFTPRQDWSDFWMFETVDDGLVGLGWEGPDGWGDTAYIDLWTGIEVEGVDFIEPVASQQDPPPAEPPMGGVLQAWGWPSGPAGGTLTFQGEGLEAMTPRAVRHDGDGWGLVEGSCLHHEARVFTADDRVWLATRDGDAVSWGHF